MSLVFCLLVVAGWVQAQTPRSPTAGNSFEAKVHVISANLPANTESGKISLK